MNVFPRLLCLATLATAAFAQMPARLSRPIPHPAAESLTRQRQADVIAPSQQPTATALNTPERIALPTATVLRLKLDRSISTASARPGEQFTATLTRPVEVKAAPSSPPEPP